MKETITLTKHIKDYRNGNVDMLPADELDLIPFADGKRRKQYTKRVVLHIARYEPSNLCCFVCTPAMLVANNWFYASLLDIITTKFKPNETIYFYKTIPSNSFA